MKRIVRMLGLAMVLTALLVASISGAVFAANGPGPNYEECPSYETCPGCEATCPCDCQNDECLGPGPHGSGAGNSYGYLGPHGNGPQYGKVTE